jgi:hypothetical protein
MECFKVQSSVRVLDNPARIRPGFLWITATPIGTVHWHYFL